MIKLQKTFVLPGPPSPSGFTYLTVDGSKISTVTCLCLLLIFATLCGFPSALFCDLSIQCWPLFCVPDSPAPFLKSDPPAKQSTSSVHWAPPPRYTQRGGVTFFLLVYWCYDPFLAPQTPLLGYPFT